MDAVEDIKSRLSIEDVIGQYVELKRAGRNFKGLSPFSNERTPSFMVSPEKQIWHDFSSGKGGNMFSFVMEMEGLDFKGALELLARKAGVDLEQYRTSGKGGSRTQEKERLYAALELAAKFYQANFIKNRIALEYVFKKRQFTKQTVRSWILGYSPNTDSALCDFLKRKNFSDKEIKDAGLSAQRYRGVGDMFRGRLMIPLQDPQGRVIGFTARILEDNPNAPKYINTPQTILYDKSRHVYGLHLAKDSIRRNKFAVLAEGNLDVISSHQAGVEQVVATAGTALTEQHLKTIGRFTDDIRLCFDADNAGLNATERAIPIASKVGVSLSIITIPSGKDPDELVKQDVELWKSTIEQKQDVLEWLISRYAKLSDLHTQKGRRDFKQAVLTSLQKVESSGEQDLYAQKIATILGYNIEAVREELKLLKSGENSFSKSKNVVKKLPDASQKRLNEFRVIQNNFLSLTLMMPPLRSKLDEHIEGMLPDDEAKKLARFLLTTPDFVGEVNKAEPLKPLADYVKILSLLFEETYQGRELIELDRTATRLKANLVAHYVKLQKERIAHEMQNADEERTLQLMDAANKLTNLLRQYQGGANA